MKKIVAILLAGVLTFGAAVTAFAAPSSTGDTTTARTESVIASVSASDIPEGDSVVIIDKFTEAGQVGVNEIKADTKAAATEAGISADIAAKLTLKDVFELTLKSLNEYNGTATITFNVPGVTKNSVAYVLHYNEKTAAWENVTTGLGNNTITATFKTGFSPVAIVVDESTLDKTAAASAGASPKTGEAPVMGILFAVAAVAVAGMAVSRRKRFA